MTASSRANRAVCPNPASTGFASASGVVLNRRVLGEGDLYLTLFLKGWGIVFVSARGAASGKVRFGGGTEPLVWGTFTLYQGKGGEGGKSYLKGVDVADDMLELRSRAGALFAVIRWAKLLTRHLPVGHPSDDLLANLYWSMKLTAGGEIPIEALEWRFLWRWLKSWGLAPSLADCLDCVPGELELLRKVAAAKSSELEAFVSQNSSLKRTLDERRRLFANAARRIETFLYEMCKQCQQLKLGNRGQGVHDPLRGAGRSPVVLA
jgi:DNA repair protein RecO